MSAKQKDSPFETLATAPPAWSAAAASGAAREHFGVDGAATALVSERDQNFLITARDGARHVLKIANAAEDPAVTDFQNQALLHIAAYAPDFPVPRVRLTLDGYGQAQIERAGARHIVRCLTWVDGTPWGEVATTPNLRRNLGMTLARLGQALRGFYHESARPPLLWDMQHASRLRDLIDHIEDAGQRRLVERTLDRFDAHCEPLLPTLRAQVIFNDLNPSNVLVDPQRPEQVAGVIDFGDIVHGPLIIDVAVAAAYQSLDTDAPLDAAAAFVGAYHAQAPLESAELDILFDLIATRLSTTVAISSWRAAKYPENRDYVLRNAQSAREMLSKFSALPRAQAQRAFRRACGLPDAAAQGTPAPRVEQLLERRKWLLGPAYRLFYERPVHLVRGEGIWLFDADGKRYLDVYNNVAHVGHCHPHVASALNRQARTLNTHTRYLHETVLDYAERLTGLFPDGLDSAMFCCTGSEANELALRIAAACTGGDGIIVVEHCYHGNTRAIARLSTDYYDAHETPAPHSRAVQAPDCYRGALLAEDDLADYYANQVGAAIVSLRAAGIQPSALLLDTIFSSNGIVTPPPEYLARAVALVRDAGGLFIADEVQAGFGRTGGHLWGFERHGVVPDIATLGKPMGNGHPLSAVVTTPEILARFAQHTRYFNTFGGNPVSCAVGLAVLEVIERENLLDNARDVGAYLRAGLATLQARHPIIGDVRGAGLFVAAELVRDPDTLEPAGVEAHKVVNDLREQGVLISMTGPHANVLKMRPPMVFSRANADQLLESLDAALGAV